MRFTIDKDGNQIGDFEYNEKKFVTPFDNRVGMAPDVIEAERGDEPAGSAPIGSGTEESHYSDPGDGMRGF